MFGNAYSDRLLLGKATGDLSIARSHLQHIQNEALAAARSISESRRIRGMVQGDLKNVALAEVLASRQENIGFDFLAILDPLGNVLAASESLVAGDPYVELAVVKDVQRTGKPLAGLEVLAPEKMFRLSGDLPGQAHIRLVDTAKAEPSLHTQEFRGLMVVVAVPMLNEAGACWAWWLADFCSIVARTLSIISPRSSRQVACVSWVDEAW
ncbi:hypothetical protein [Dechloromonas sp. A34]|uniref:hypothetical protein n=1 Tax=Dechloromonas sp. A34 TaxID=447588 RepID=UPI002248ED2E|nr:hypothetical protein [Dechloromonas sp. A34]